MAAPSAEAGILGEPSYVWRSGQERRLQIVQRYIPLKDRRVLDVGCGVDISLSRLRTAAETTQNLVAAVGERLPFRDGSFDVVLLNEVIEHVHDDRQTLQEALRVVGPGGHVVIFAPNRLYPFETHGVYLGRRYVFGNIPLVNYLPNAARNRLVPHARAYTAAGLRRLINGLPARVVVESYVYPGFDNIAARSRLGGRLLREALYRAEQTPLRRFGLSHLLILQKR